MLLRNFRQINLFPNGFIYLYLFIERKKKKGNVSLKTNETLFVPKKDFSEKSDFLGLM